MATTVASLQAVLSLEKGDFDREVQSASKSVSAFGSTLQGILAVAGGNLLSGAITGVAKSIGGLASAAGSFVKEGIASNAQFEDFSTRFKVLLGSAEAAQTRMEELAEFGKRTPFELPGVVKADLVLQSFGFHAEDATQKFGFSGDKIREIAGDVASGTGAAFEEIAGYLGRFASGSTGEAIMRFQELGIVTREELSKMGLSFNNAGSLILGTGGNVEKLNDQLEVARMRYSEMAAGGKASESSLLAAQNRIEELTQKIQAASGSTMDLGGATEIVLQAMAEKYGGLMAAQSMTLNGLLSNLADWKDNTIREITAPIFELLRDKLAGFVEWLSGPKVAGMIDHTVRIITGLFGSFRYIIDNIVIPGIQNFGAMIFSQGVSPLTALERFINYKVIPTLATFARWFFDEGLPAVVEFVQGITKAYQSGGIEGVVQKILTSLQSAWPNIKKVLISWATSFWDWVTGSDGVLSRGTTSLNSILEYIWKWALSTETQGQLRKLGGGITIAFLGGIDAIVNGGGADSTMRNVLNGLLKAVIKAQTILVDIGEAIGDGIIEGFAKSLGVSGSTSWVKSALSGAFKGVNPLAGLSPGFATGTDMIVPPGYPNDSYIFRASSGERVKVDRPSQTNQFNLNINTSAPYEPIIQDFNMMRSMVGA